MALFAFSIASASYRSFRSTNSCDAGVIIAMETSQSEKNLVSIANTFDPRDSMRTPPAHLSMCRALRGFESPVAEILRYFEPGIPVSAAWAGG
jgi:hypothetical protein